VEWGDPAALLDTEKHLPPMIQIDAKITKIIYNGSRIQGFCSVA
jgi:hypothetical protein